MKYFFFILLTMYSTLVFSQNTSCEDLISNIEVNARLDDSALIIGSSAISSAKKYSYDGQGFVVINFKGDTLGSSYIFCGISDERWDYFKRKGTYGSWGDAYHDYIRGRECNCY
jgi:hypothetical protein